MRAISIAALLASAALATPAAALTIGFGAAGQTTTTRTVDSDDDVNVDFTSSFAGSACDVEDAPFGTIPDPTDPDGERTLGEFSTDRTSELGRRLQPGTAVGGATTSNCYLYTNIDSPSGAIALSPTVDPGATFASYIGFLWASIDSANQLEFYDVDGNPLALTIGDLDNILTGTEAATLFGFAVDATVDRFIDIDFTETDNFGQIWLRTSNYAFEVDNLAIVLDVTSGGDGTTVGLTAAPPSVTVPAPAALALFGLGLGAVVRRRHR